MSKARLPLLAALLTLTSCASGPLPLPAVQMANLDVPPAKLVECPRDLPPIDKALAGVSWEKAKGPILANYVAAARQYSACRDRHKALACTITAQQGVTLNGSRPVPREGCTQGEPPDIRTHTNQ